MTSVILERIKQKYRTMAWPDGPAPDLPERWLGEPDLPENGFDLSTASDVCPTGALAADSLDIGRCIFCGTCRDLAGIPFSRRFAMARVNRGDLVLHSGKDKVNYAADAAEARLALIREQFSHSFKLRQVSAGGCNVCETDCNVLGTLAWDMGRFGIAFVASPRHADGILVTGPVTDNMRLALEKTYAAVPDPKVVIAAGACAISGGIYGDGTGAGALDSLLPIDLYIPGCPPHPLVILEGLLRLLGRL